VGDTLQFLKDVIQIPGLLKEIFGDLAKPGVTQVGKALSTIIGFGNTVLLPFHLANERTRLAVESNLEKYRKQLEAVPEEKITPVAPEVGVPIVEKIGYVTDETLSDLYVNLLAKASTVGTNHLAHPSFVNILNNLSPDETVILNAFYMFNLISLPFLSVIWQRKGKKENIELPDILSGIEKELPLAFPDNITAYFSNLAGLGMVQVKYNRRIIPETVYSGLQEGYQPYYQKLGPIHFGGDEDYILKFELSRIDLTPFGKLFLNSCLKKLNRERGSATPPPKS
jgi:Abortive infection alpha